MTERRPEQIQREIEQARVKLAGAVDQLTYRTSPKRVAASAKLTLRQHAQSPVGKAVIGVTGGLVVLLIVRRIRRGRS